MVRGGEGLVQGATWLYGPVLLGPVDLGAGEEGCTAEITWRTRVIENKPVLAASIIRLDVTNSSNQTILTLDLLRHDERRSLKTVGQP